MLSHHKIPWLTVPVFPGVLVKVGNNFVRWLNIKSKLSKKWREAQLSITALFSIIHPLQKSPVQKTRCQPFAGEMCSTLRCRFTSLLYTSAAGSRSCRHLKTCHFHYATISMQARYMLGWEVNYDSWAVQLVTSTQDSHYILILKFKAFSRILQLQFSMQIYSMDSIYSNI